MVLGDIFKLVFTMGQVNVVGQCTLWFRQEVAVLPPDERATLANDFTGRILTPAVNGLRACLSNTTGITAVTVQRYIPYEEGVFTLPITANNGGQRSGTPLPTLCAPCITILTPRGGRSGRGRFYPFPPAAADQASNQWTATQMNALDTVMVALNAGYGLQAGYEATGFRLGVWSRKLAGASPPFDANGFSPISGWIVRPEVRGLTRRTFSIA
jgi:hypothetical protein